MWLKVKAQDDKFLEFFTGRDEEDGLSVYLLHQGGRARPGKGAPHEMVVMLEAAGAFAALYRVIVKYMGHYKERKLTLERADQRLTIRGENLPKESVLQRELFPEVRDEGSETANESEWNGVVFIWHRRVLFVGEAGTSRDQAVHAIKICIPLNGDFVLKVGSDIRRYSAAIINARVKHTVICDREKVFLLYLLPETEEARSVSRKYLKADKVYEIPRDLARSWLPPQDKRGGEKYKKWGCTYSGAACDEVIRGLGLPPSTALSGKLYDGVRGAIEYVDSEIRAQSNAAVFDEERFKASAVADWLGVREDDLVKDFKKQVGITPLRFFHELQLLAALERCAIKEEEEKKLLTALGQNGMDETKRAKMSRRLKEIEREGLLKEIAKSLGFGSLANFDNRVRSRLGINLSDLRSQDQSVFLACQNTVVKNKAPPRRRPSHNLEDLNKLSPSNPQNILNLGIFSYAGRLYGCKVNV
jgi:AraC-like DNA-binding protein